MYHRQSVQSAISLRQLSNGTYIFKAQLKNGETFIQKILVSK